MQQSLRQASVRAVTGTTYSYEGDFHALFTAHSIADGSFNERLLGWINYKLTETFDNLPEAMQALADENTATNFSSMGTFDCDPV